jgi:hypothetical protein
MGLNIMIDKCNQNHGGLLRSTAMFKGLTVSRCNVCNSHNVEGSPQWVVGDLADEAVRYWLTRLANEEIDRRAHWAEVTQSPFDDPRWTEVYG